MYLLFIDSGTTNTRIRLVEEGSTQVIDSVNKKCGVRNTAIEGSNQTLKQFIFEGIEDLLSKQSLSREEVRYVVCSGMITSKLGLVEIEHISSPGSESDFASNAVLKYYDEIPNMPFIFITGFKNNQNSKPNPAFEDVISMDVLRGEEVESFGILNHIPLEGNGMIALPGSHTKFVFIDRKKRISSCLSTLGGEMIASIRSETILSDSIPDSLIQEIDYKMINLGFQHASNYGLNRVLYQSRLLDMFTEATEEQRSNYYVGAILEGDIKALLKYVENHQLEWIVVGGSNPLRSVFYQLLSYAFPGQSIKETSDELVENCTIIGAKHIAESVIFNRRESS